MNVGSVANRLLKATFATVPAQPATTAGETLEKPLEKALDGVASEILNEHFDACFDERFNPREGFELAKLLALILVTGGLYLIYVLVASISMLANREALLQGKEHLAGYDLDRQLVKDVCSEIKNKILASKDNDHQVIFEFESRNKKESYWVKFHAHQDTKGSPSIEQSISLDGGKTYERRSLKTNHNCRSLPDLLENLRDAFVSWERKGNEKFLEDAENSYKNNIVKFFKGKNIHAEVGVDSDGWDNPIHKFGDFFLYPPLESSDKDKYPVQEFIDDHCKNKALQDKLLLVPYLAKGGLVDYHQREKQHNHMVLLVIKNGVCVAVDHKPQGAGIHANSIVPKGNAQVSVAHLNWQDLTDIESSERFVFFMVAKLIDAYPQNSKVRAIKTPQALFDSFFNQIPRNAEDPSEGPSSRSASVGNDFNDVGNRLVSPTPSNLLDDSSETEVAPRVVGPSPQPSTRSSTTGSSATASSNAAPLVETYDVFTSCPTFPSSESSPPSSPRRSDTYSPPVSAPSSRRGSEGNGTTTQTTNSGDLPITPEPNTSSTAALSSMTTTSSTSTANQPAAAAPATGVVKSVVDFFTQFLSPTPPSAPVQTSSAVASSGYPFPLPPFPARPSDVDKTKAPTTPLGNSSGTSPLPPPED